MSGICGMLALSRQQPAVDSVLRNLERRGPDGTHIWETGTITLGHTLLATTPESLAEVLPLTDRSTGSTITADVRLDNREELIAALRLGDVTRVIGDGELILRAYGKWGEECPTHLLGDFAFAIWDPTKERLFCARDQVGMRQLIYHHAPGELFAFATEADALVAHPQVPKRLNHGRIADFLDGLEGLDFTSTFFKEVFRLPPGHTLSVDSTGLALRRYWELLPGPELKLETDRDYADAFLEVFTQAVRCRLRSSGQVGSMLSGGLDSTSIAAVAANLLADECRGPLPTFSAINSVVAGCAESQAIKAASRSPLFAPTLIRPQDLNRNNGEVLRTTQGCAEPFDAYLVISRAIYSAARQQSVNIVLDGAGADLVLTPGNYVAGLLRQRKIHTAAREAQLEAKFWGPIWPTRRILLPAIWAAFSPASLRTLRWRITWWAEDRWMRLGLGTVSREFAQETKLAQRRQHFRRHLSQERPIDPAYRARSICHPHLVVARERYDRVAASFAVEPRDPFMDLRVIQFALSLPAGQLQADGWPKTILRRAMAGKIPSEIVWRRGKPHLGWTYTTEIIRQWALHPAEQVRDQRVMSLLGRGLGSKVDSGADKSVWYKLTILKTWLARNGFSG